MRRAVVRPVIRLCCFLCPVCPPPAQPVIWGHPVTTADWKGVRPFFRTCWGRGGRAGHRRRCACVNPPRLVCCVARWIAAGEASPGVRVAPRAPSKTPRVFRARCALRPAPPPRSARARSLGPPDTPEHRRSLRGRAALPPSVANDLLRATNHAGVPERETPAAPPPPPAPLVLFSPSCLPRAPVPTGTPPVYR